ASNSLGLIVSAAAWIDRRSRCTPGFYSGSGPVITVESKIATTDVSLTLGMTTLVLPKPEMQDLQRYEWDRVVRTSRGGELQVYIDPDWPKNKVFAISWNNLSAAKKTALQQFLIDSLGQLVTYVDYEGNSHMVLIRNPMSDFTQLNRCRWSVRLELEE
ncbi:MAG: hypothetical protein HC888_15210, partial [Candidatus Competibacteraceae bacterium]|nr:hypothetical protein [Candidatus Competibacteraceae bacterium]